MSDGLETSTKNRWLIAGAVLLGAFISVMDASIINVALPYMMGNYGQTLSAITWVATSYSITAIIVIIMTGWLSTLLGRKNLLIGSFILFTIGSILCGLASTFTEMILFRILQGIGGGSLVPIAQAILRETFPKKQIGMAMAIFGMGIVLAPALGPIVGGWLIDHYGWPWIFYINIPVSLLGIWMILRFVHDPPYLKRGVKSTDWMGIFLLTLGLSGLQIVLERGQEMNWLDSSFIVAWTLVSALSLLTLVFWELFFTREPIIDFHVLRNLPLALSSIVIFLFGIGLFGTTFILPQFTQSLLGYSAYQSGLTLLPRAFALFIFMPFVGRLYNYIDAKYLIITGILITCVSYKYLAHISLQVSFPNLVPILLLMGAGMGFIFVPLSTVSMSTVARENMTQAAGFYTLMQRVGGNLGYAITVTILQRRIQFHRVSLTQHITGTNPQFQALFGKFLGFLHIHGYGPVDDRAVSFRLFDGIVRRQAAMLSYNDLSWIFMAMFLFTLIFVFLMPKNRGSKHEAEGGPIAE